MTNREAKIEQAKCDVRQQESRVREAQKNLEYGYEKAKAEMEREYAKLKSELERAHISLEAEKIRLRRIEDNLLDEPHDL